MRLLAIDLGTSTFKGAILNLDAFSIDASMARPAPAAHATAIPGRHETPFQSLLDAADDLLLRLSQKAPDARHLVLSGQMHGFAVMDTAGRPLSPFISWKDQRTLEPHPQGNGSWLEVLLARISQEEIALLGNELRSGLGALSLAALHQEHPFPQGSIPLPIADAVINAWTGDPARIDPSFAASFGCYDLQRQAWHPGVIARWNLDAFHWPDIALSPAPVYHLRRHAREFCVFPPLGDHQAALLGTGLRSGELSLNISTGSQIAASVPHFQPGPYQTRPFIPGTFLNTITHLPAGSMLNLLVNLLTEIPGAREDPWTYIHQAVEKIPHTPMTLDLSFSPCLTGNQGSMHGLTEDTLQVGHLFRAAFAQMAAHYHHHAGSLDPERPWEKIVLSGSLARRSTALREEIASRFQLPLRLSHHDEETFHGLLRWAALGLEATAPNIPLESSPSALLDHPSASSEEKPQKMLEPSDG